MLEQWMTDGGKAAIQTLSSKGLLNTPAEWNTPEALAKGTPQYLFWIMLNRVTDYIEKHPKK